MAVNHCLFKEPSDFTLLFARWTHLTIYCTLMPACRAWLSLHPLFSAYPLSGAYLLTTYTYKCMRLESMLHRLTRCMHALSKPRTHKAHNRHGQWLKRPDLKACQGMSKGRDGTALGQDRKALRQWAFEKFTDISKVLQPSPSAKMAWHGNFTVAVFSLHSAVDRVEWKNRSSRKWHLRPADCSQHLSSSFCCPCHALAALC